MVCFRRKSKFGEFSRATSIFFNQKMDNGFVLRTPKCINPENIIQIGAVLETKFPTFSKFYAQENAKCQSLIILNEILWF
jgi:hypothetical protein